MRISKVLAVLALVVASLVGASAWAADASLHDVYQAAQSGRLKEAEAMMDQVLRDHPASAKAHFVEAEILARDGKISEARNELATAEKLQPGLAFARPQAVEALRARLRGGSGASAERAQTDANPLSWLLWGGVALVFIVVAARWMQKRSRYGAYVNGPAMPQNLASSAMAPAGYGAYPGAVPMGGTGGGVGSGILGGLATGAAVGAGVVAGEALMHRVLGGNENRVVREPEAEPAPYDMGGSDFGVSGGWDDGGSSDLGSLGGDDWS
ncbi:tetratricopeptide repeat protein [Niveibacterium terrae]|uniref:tetratricopeptide repeat protein n=1 Tax=Niveibacterium terrae TaxID=3373598 RepID=UPI003A9329D8